MKSNGSDTAHPEGPFRPLSVRRPAASARAQASAGEAAPARAMSDLCWQPSYERASVDRFLADVDAERVRLQGVIAATKRHLETLRVAAARRAEAEAEFAAQVLAVQQELEGIEREHRESLEAIDTVAGHAAARLLDAAREEASAMRAAAAAVVGPGHVRADSGEPRSGRPVDGRHDER